jgi:hypothetical protein
MPARRSFVCELTASRCSGGPSHFCGDQAVTDIVHLTTTTGKHGCDDSVDNLWNHQRLPVGNLSRCMVTTEANYCTKFRYTQFNWGDAYPACAEEIRRGVLQCDDCESLGMVGWLVMGAYI